MYFSKKNLRISRWAINEAEVLRSKEGPRLVISARDIKVLAVGCQQTGQKTYSGPLLLRFTTAVTLGRSRYHQAITSRIGLST
jgi:hypothetical protein